MKGIEKVCTQRGRGNRGKNNFLRLFLFCFGVYIFFSFWEWSVEICIFLSCSIFLRYNLQAVDMVATHLIHKYRHGREVWLYIGHEKHAYIYSIPKPVDSMLIWKGRKEKSGMSGHCELNFSSFKKNVPHPWRSACTRHSWCTEGARFDWSKCVLSEIRCPLAWRL